jgi:hypothetical protein
MFIERRKSDHEHNHFREFVVPGKFTTRGMASMSVK